MKYMFHDRLYEKPYAPYYDAYKGQVFVIDHVHPDETLLNHQCAHVWVKCITDETIKVSGYVHVCDLVEIK